MVIKTDASSTAASPAAAEQPPPAVVRDVAALRAADFPRLDPPGPLDGEREPRFQAVVRRSVLNDIHQHGRSSPEVEVCGVLVGNVYQDGSAPFLYVEGSIRGTHAAGRETQVTFTAETWAAIQERMERDFPDKKILGWYHTHPGFGIFLSDMDLFIHENFFGEPWQVAYVYDPKGGEDGLFTWQAGKAAEDEYLVEADQVNSDPPQWRTAGKEGADLPPATMAELSGRVQALEKRLRWVVAVLVVMVLAMVVLPLVGLLFVPEVQQRLFPPAGDSGPAPSSARGQ